MGLVIFSCSLSLPFCQKKIIDCIVNMAAAQLAAGTAVSCGLPKETNKLYSLAVSSKGFRCWVGKRRSFGAKLLLPSPIIRRRESFPRLNCQLRPDCNVESDDVEETVALKQESLSLDSNGGPRYDHLFVCLEKDEILQCI